MKVILTLKAKADLKEIWNWNAKDRGSSHADAYLAFIGKHIEGLSKTYVRGKAVATQPDLRYLLIQRRTGGHGHIAVYSIEAGEIIVAHVFHSAQDWQSRV